MLWWADYWLDEKVGRPTAFFQFSQHIEPELHPFIFGQPHPQQFFLFLTIYRRVFLKNPHSICTNILIYKQ
ncbi:hypothetical protein DP20_2691 [Shigella flexneri]|nr:hypothetical protein DP20_2691 [Shigella flexneri]SRN41753.1 Uncharacterised protein [Shigella flexneri]